jgi:hypothetical protein
VCVVLLCGVELGSDRVKRHRQRSGTFGQDGVDGGHQQTGSLAGKTYLT